MILYMVVPGVTLLEYLAAKIGGLNTKGKEFRFLFLATSFIVASLIYGLRDPVVGDDTIYYVNEFSHIKSIAFMEIIQGRYTGDIVVDTEPAFLIVIWIFARLGFSRWMFLMTMGMISNFLYLRAISRISPRVVVSVFSYLFFYTFLQGMNIMQQVIATGILLNALEYFQRKQYLKYVMGVIVAGLFHFMCFSLLLFIPVIFLKTRKRLITAMIVVFAGVTNSLSFLLLLSQTIFPHFMWYFDRNYHAGLRVGFSSTLVLMMEILVIGLLLIQFNKKQNDYRLISFLVVTLSVAAASMLMMPVFGIFERIAFFYNTFIIIGAGFAFDGLSDKKAENIMLIVYYAGIIMYFVYMLIRNVCGVVPFVVYGDGIG